MASGFLKDIEQLIANHHRFVEYNTKDTYDIETDFYIVNEQGVVANNRHFINYTRQQYQPNGDATTEGQSLQAIGYIYAYLATQDKRYLDWAEWYTEAYFTYFYRGQPIPETPQRWICNWIINGKEPVLANFPLADTEVPPQGGFKGVLFNFTNGVTQIPYGAPHWGEYLDVCRFGFAENGILGWNSMTAAVRQKTADGKPDWFVPALPKYDVDWIVTWSREKITATGTVIETDVDPALIGTVKMKDESINGLWHLVYATRNPVSAGGTYIERNEPQHNRPIHVPLRGDVNQMSNAADAEVWMVDVTYLLWKITGKEKYKKAMDAILFTANEYLMIDRDLAFFRREIGGTTPFTDGISYDFTVPPDIPREYTRDAAGLTIVEMEAAGTLAMEQQAVRYRIDKNSTLVTEWTGRGNNGAVVNATIRLVIREFKDAGASRVYEYSPPGRSSSIVSRLAFRLDRLIATQTESGQPYMVGTPSATVGIGTGTYTQIFNPNVLGDRDTNVMRLNLVDSSSQALIGFWNMPGARLNPTSISYRCEHALHMRVVDDEGWRWYWPLPATTGWVTHPLLRENLVLDSWQPNRDGRDDPESAVFDDLDQVIIVADNQVGAVYAYFYCMNEVPDLFDEDDGWTQYYRITFNCSEPYTARLGDCVVEDFRQDGLAYTPGLLPFSNIYQVGSSQFNAWRGLPYPGYQYPGIHAHGFDPDDDIKMANVIDFLYDSQQYYYNRFGQLGPDAYAYIWDRPDNTVYGDPDTFIMDQWVEGRAWSGYQPRGFCWAARTWQQLVFSGQPVPAKLIAYCTNWANWLIQYAKDAETTTGGVWLPYTIPTDRLPTPGEGGFNGHMAGLYLAGLAMVGSVAPNDELDLYMRKFYAHIKSRMIVMEDRPHHPMNGSWSPWHSPNTDGGMFFGFWTGELMRGLGAYHLYLTHGGNDWYKPLAQGVYEPPQFPMVAAERPERPVPTDPIPIDPADFFQGTGGAWLDFSDQSTLFGGANGDIPITAEGQKVSRVADKSGNGNEAVQFDPARQPVFATDAQGRPCLSFTGGAFLTFGKGQLNNTGLMADSSDAFTVLAAAATTESGTTVARSGGSDRQFQIYYHTGSNDTPVVVARNFYNRTGWGLKDGSKHTVGVSWNGATMSAWYNSIHNNESLTVGSTAEQTSEHIHVGARSNPAAFTFNGRMYGVIIADRALNELERAGANSYYMGAV